MLLGVDVGGTFTDAVLIAPEGSAMYTAKVPTTPEEQSRGVMEAVRAVLAQAGAEPSQVERFAHGMTVATNALLEFSEARPPARTALIATAGFADIVELGRQARAHLYRLCAAVPAPLVPAELRFEAPERMTPDGPLRALDPREAEELVERIAQAGQNGQMGHTGHTGQDERAPQAGRENIESGRENVESVAVALLHSYAHPEHERLLGELLAARLPTVHVSLSHELVGTFREYERAATTEVDAALSPLLSAYLRRLGEQADELGLTRPAIMQSSGGLTDAEGAAAHAARTALSGPAGGVRGALVLAEQAGERDVVCFDMGGTSCDVCLIAGGRVAETAEGRVAGRPLALAMLDIHTVGAGGGSIAWRDAGGALRVGPHSAGANPGPACYGRGGEHPTVTDANLLLGRLQADASPASGMRLDQALPASGMRPDQALPASGMRPDQALPASGMRPDQALPASGMRLDRDAAERAVAALAATLELSTERCAEGIVRVTEAEMLGALRAITVERGIDPRGFALMPFGGAGPLHAAALARELGIRRILVPRASGVLCALGLAAAAPRRDAARTVTLAGESLDAERLAAERAALVAQACAELGEPTAHVAVRYELRYRGQSFELAVDEQDVQEPSGATPDPDMLREAFARTHEQRYGYRDDGLEVELVTIRVSAWGSTPRLRLASAEGEPAPGTAIEGPTVCSLPGSTLYVPDGWRGTVDDYGTVQLRDEGTGA